jgi:hypothetical protein
MDPFVDQRRDHTMCNYKLLTATRWRVVVPAYCVGQHPHRPGVGRPANGRRDRSGSHASNSAFVEGVRMPALVAPMVLVISRSTAASRFAHQLDPLGRQQHVLQNVRDSGFDHA